MLDISGSYLKMDRATLIALRDFCASYNPATTPSNPSDPKGFRVIKQDLSKGIPKHLVIAKSFALPALQDKHDMLPRYTKVISPKVSMSIDGIAKTDVRSIRRTYVATGINVKGYMVVEGDSAVRQFLSDSSTIVVFKESMSVNADSPYHMVTQLKNITDTNANGSVEDEAQQVFLPYDSVSAGYIGICFAIEDFALITPTIISKMIENAPSYFAVRQDAVFEPVSGFTKDDGTPLRFVDKTTSTLTVDGVPHAISSWNFRSYVSTVSGKVVDKTVQKDGSDGIFEFNSSSYTSDSDTYLPNGGVFNGFNGSVFSKNFDMFVRKTSKRSASVFQTMLDTVESLSKAQAPKTSLFAEYFPTTGKEPDEVYWTRLKAQLVFARDNVRFMENPYNQLLPAILDRVSKDSSGTQEDSFPDVIRDRVDLVVGINFVDDYMAIDVDNWIPIDDLKYAVDYSLQDVGKVDYNEIALRNSCLNIIMTKPTERFCDPDFGTEIPNLVFERQSIDMEAVRTEIANKITKYEPRVVTFRDMIEVSIMGSGANQLNITALIYVKKSATAFRLSKTILI